MIVHFKSVVLFTLILPFLLTGCEGYEAANLKTAPLQATSFTGGEEVIIYKKPDAPKKTQKRAYTTAGRTDLFEQLQVETKEHQDVELAESITAGKILNLDELLHLDSTSQKFTLKFELTTELTTVDSLKLKAVYTFTILLENKNGFLESDHFVSAKEEPLVRMQAHCLDNQCLALKILIQKKQTDPKKTKPFKYAAALILSENPDIQISNANTHAPDTPKNEEWEKIAQAYKNKSLKVNQQTISVVGGVSKTQGRLYNGKDPLANFTTSRFSTTETAYPSDSFQLSNQPTTQTHLQSTTVGNNSHSGAIALEISEEKSPIPLGRIYIRPQTGEQTYKTAVVEKKPAPSKDKPTSDAKKKMLNAIIPVALTKELPKTLEFYTKLEPYRDNPYVLEAMEVWKGTKTGYKCGKKTQHFNRAKAENFFRKVQPLVPYFLSISMQLDTTPEVAYLSAIESEYAASSDNEYVTDEVSTDPNSTAAGLFQIVNETAEGIIGTKAYQKIFKYLGIEMKLIRSVKTDGLSDKDFRMYPTTSFLAASLLVKENYVMFHNDPAMAISGYFQGNGITSMLQKCTSIALAKTQANKDFKGADSISKCVEAAKKTQKEQRTLSKAYQNRHKYFNVTLEDVSDFGMGASCEILHYVYGWMALKFIGEDPAAHGFLTPQEINTDGLKPAIYYPNKPFSLETTDPWDVRNDDSTLISI